MKNSVVVSMALVFVCAASAWASGCSSSPRPGDAGGKASGEAIVRTARGQVGVPYRYGGNSPQSGFDCSGLVQWVFKQHGFQVPRATTEQIAFGSSVRRQDLRPGDVLIFDIQSKNYHSAIYAGGNTFVHAPSSGGKVREDNLDNVYWNKAYFKARRYLAR